VRAEIYDVMRFWLGRGVDGFRVDVIWHLMKDPQLRDNPINPAYREGQQPKLRLIPLNTADLPEVHNVIEEMRAVVDEFGGRVLIGEIYLPLEKLVAYYGRDLRGCHLPFNFSLLQVDWHAREFAIRWNEISPVSVLGATAHERQCNGIRARMPASRRWIRGCR
jgi:alpha-glucosidase